MFSYSYERLAQKLNYPIHALWTTSPRKLLILANFVLILCSVCICGVAAFLCWLLYDPLFVTGEEDWIYFRQDFSEYVLLFIRLCQLDGSGNSRIGSFSVRCDWHAWCSSGFSRTLVDLFLGNHRFHSSADVGTLRMF